MPHVRKRGNIYYVYWYEQKKHKSKPVSPIEKDAIAEAAKITLRLYAKKNGTTISNYPLLDFIQEYIKEYVNYKSLRTRKRDKITINTFLTLCPEIKTVSAFDDLSLKNYKMRRKGKAEATINRELGTLKHMQKIAFEKNYLSEDVSKKTKFLEIEDNQTGYIPSDSDLKIYFANISEPMINASIFGMLGMRAGEAVHIAPEDMDFVQNIIKIRAKEEDGWEPKNKTSARDVPMHPDYRNYFFKRYKIAVKNKYKYMCYYDDGRCLNESTLSSIIYKLKTKRLEDKIDPKFHFHSLRHKFITLAGNDNIPLIQIAKIVGHSSTKLTEKIYYHSSAKKNLESISRIDMPVKIK